MTWDTDALPETTYGAASDLVLSAEELDEEEARRASRRPAGFGTRRPQREEFSPY